MSTDLTYSVIFLADLIKLVIIFTQILGFRFGKSKRLIFLAFIIVILSNIVLLALSDISNRIFLILPVQCAFVFLLLHIKPVVAIELVFLIHFLIAIIDELTRAFFILFGFGGKVLTETEGLGINCIATISSVAVITLLAIILKRRSGSVNLVVKDFSHFTALYYFLIVLLSGGLIGYASIMAFDAEIINRVRVLILVATSGLSVIIIVLGVLIHILSILNANLKSDNLVVHKCMVDQTQQYKSITTKNEYIRKFKHDYEEHLSVLKHISLNGDMQQLAGYLNDMHEISKANSYYNTNNIIGDAIINEYYQRCDLEGIEFEVIGKFPDDLAIKEIDLCVLLSNVVKNAYEAAAKCDNRKIVEISIEYYKKRIIITVKNSVREPFFPTNESLVTTKSNKELHGIGIKNMKEIVKKYDGNIEFWMEDPHCFAMEIII